MTLAVAVILTLGRSKTLENFLLAVSKERPIEDPVAPSSTLPPLHGHGFPVCTVLGLSIWLSCRAQVIVCEAAPDFSGHEFAVSRMCIVWLICLSATAHAALHIVVTSINAIMTSPNLSQHIGMCTPSVYCHICICQLYGMCMRYYIFIM